MGTAGDRPHLRVIVPEGLPPVAVMLDQEDLDRLQEAENNPDKFVVSAPTDGQKLGVLTVICFILNRTIGEWLRPRNGEQITSED